MKNGILSFFIVLAAICTISTGGVLSPDSDLNIGYIALDGIGGVPRPGPSPIAPIQKSEMNGMNPVDPKTVAGVSVLEPIGPDFAATQSITKAIETSSGYKKILAGFSSGAMDPVDPNTVSDVRFDLPSIPLPKIIDSQITGIICTPQGSGPDFSGTYVITKADEPKGGLKGQVMAGGHWGEISAPVDPKTVALDKSNPKGDNGV